MEHCLRIPEVLCYICDSLDERSALSMALTQRAFLEPALDRLWSRLTSFEPLMACLPDDLLRIEEKEAFLAPEKGPLQVMFLERALKLSDLQRYMDFYSRRIKSLRPCWRTCRTWPSIEVFQAMQIATDWVPGALTPRLEDFLWLAPYQLNEVYGDALATHFPLCMPLFFGPTLTSVELQVHVYNPLYSSFIKSVSRDLPSRLRKLNIDIEDTQDYDLEDDGTFPFVHEYLTRAMWPKLEELRLGGFFVSPHLTSSLVRHLATLPNLTTLALMDFVDVPSPDAPEESDSLQVDDPTIDADGFPSLKHLHLSCDTVSGVIHFLPYLPPTNGVTDLECACYEFTITGDVQFVVDAIQEYLNPLALQELTLRMKRFGEEEHDIRIERDNDGKLDTTPLFAISSGDDYRRVLDIDPLLAFQNLVKLELHVNGQIRLMPDLIELLPTAWPDIQHLNISTSYHSFAFEGYRPSGYLTWRIIHLLTLLVCTVLLALCMANYGVLELPFSSTSPRVGGSHISSQSRVGPFVASFLKSVVPQCEGPRCFSLHSSLEQRLSSFWAQWKPVLEHVTHWHKE